MAKPTPLKTPMMVTPNLIPAASVSEIIDRGEQLDLSTARPAAWPAADMSRPNDRHATIYEAKSSGRQVELILSSKPHVLQGGSTVGSVFAAMASLAQMPIRTFRLTTGGRELRDMDAVLPINTLVFHALRCKGGAPTAAWQQTNQTAAASHEAALSEADRVGTLAWLHQLLSMHNLTHDQATVANIARRENISEAQASTLIQEVLFPSPQQTRTSCIERLKEVFQTFPDFMRDFLRNGGNRLIPSDEEGWSALDAILEILCQHTISTAAKLTNLSRLHKVEYEDDRSFRRTGTHQALLAGRTVSETVVLSNLSIATKQPLLTALNYLNLLQESWPERILKDRL